MGINGLQKDEAILSEIGRRLARRRIDRGLTQAELAEQAGIGKRTLERFEAGDGSQLSVFIRILRVLDLIDDLDQWIPEPGVSPLALLKLKGKERHRASSKRNRVAEPGPEWTWGDQ